MKKLLLLLLLLITLIFVVGCQETVVCNKPYILVGTDCCLDENDDNVCDVDQTSIVGNNEDLKSVVKCMDADNGDPDFKGKFTFSNKGVYEEGYDKCTGGSYRKQILEEFICGEIINIGDTFTTSSNPIHKWKSFPDSVWKEVKYLGADNVNEDNPMIRLESVSTGQRYQSQYKIQDYNINGSLSLFEFRNTLFVSVSNNSVDDFSLMHVMTVIDCNESNKICQKGACVEVEEIEPVEKIVEESVPELNDESDKNDVGELIEKIEYYDNGKKKKMYAVSSDGKKQGPYKSWHNNGQLAGEGNYVDDMPHGLGEGWNEDGQLMGIENYDNGKKHGLFQSWHENGQKQFEGNFANDKVHGKVIYWYTTGQKWIEENYDNGMPHGLKQEWHPNGQLKVKGNYVNAISDGLWQGWHSNGQLEGEANYVDGEIVSMKEWDEDGNPIE